jgi:hypothetical protein
MKRLPERSEELEDALVYTAGRRALEALRRGPSVRPQTRGRGPFANLREPVRRTSSPSRSGWPRRPATGR